MATPTGTPGGSSVRGFPGRAPGRRGQHGQSAVFVLLFLGILLISLNFIYKQGRITSDKMEMQNAADAVAYSISLSEARDLNFAAYLNRAMVANEVAIGQLLGLASWAQLVNSYGDFLNAFAKPIFPIPIVGQAINGAIGGVAAVFKVPGAVLTRFLGILANIGTSFMHISNKVYSYAQWGYHVATAILSFGTIDEMLERNAPPGTRISDYGWISLVSHLATYGSPTAVVAQLTNGNHGDTSALLPAGTPEAVKEQFKQFVEFHHPKFKVKASDYANGDKGEAEGFERFSAIVRDSRDPFTLDRTWTLDPFDFFAPVIDPLPLLSVRNGNVNFDLEFDFSVCGDLGFCFPGVDGGVDFDLNFYFGIGVVRNGASELRLLIPASGTFEAGSIANWSSADTAALDARMGMSLDIELWVETFITGRLSAGATGGFVLGTPNPNQLKIQPVTLSLAGFDFDIVPGFTIPFPTQAPFGAAFTEVGKTTPNNLKLATMAHTKVGGPLPPTNAYGGAPNVGLGSVWVLPAIPPVAFPASGVVPGPSPPLMPPGVMQRSDTLIGPAYGDQTNRVNKSYGGLPGYIDTSGVDQTLFGFGAPQLTVSLVLKEDMHDLDRGDAVTDLDTAGQHPEMGDPATALTSNGLRLTDGMADGGLGGLFGADPKLHTVAQSEVYFKRPNDLDWFRRLDGREEHGSAFNPYWQARLTELPYLASVTALMVEQGEDFTGTTELISQVIGDITSRMDKLFDMLDAIGLGLLVP